MTKLLYYWGKPPGVPVEEAVKDVGEGWRPLVTKLIDDLFELGWDGYVEQIKEKYGGLRFYCNLPEDLGDDAIDRAFALIDAAESASETICETCGAAGVVVKEKGWLRAACPNHSGAEP